MIYEYLKHGQAYAIRTEELVRLTGCRSARELRSKIAKERTQGHLILSSCKHGGGYFLPSDGPEGRAEIEAFCATLRARALNTLFILRDSKKALAVLDGQLKIKENGGE